MHEGEDERRFRLSKKQIPSGWNTIKFVNVDPVSHFIYMNKVKESARDELGEVTREAWMNAVNLPFQEAWDPFFACEIDAEAFGEKLGQALPAWYFEGGDTDQRRSWSSCRWGNLKDHPAA